MSFSSFTILFLIVALFFCWLAATLFLPFDQHRLFIIVCGFAFFLLISLAISFRGLIGFLKDSAAPSVSPRAFFRQSVNSHELEFVSETYQTVLAQLQTQQKELSELHAQIGERAASLEVFNQHVVSSLPTGLIAFDLEGLARVVNKPAQEIFELPATENFAKISYRDLFSSTPSVLEIISNSLIKNKYTTRSEFDYQTRNEQKRLALTVAPLQIYSKISGVLCLIADVTEVNQLREQIALQRNLESLGLMSAGLAHEFKNSLAALQVYTQFLNRLALNEQGHEAAAALTRELRGLSEMVTAFLDFSRPKPLTINVVSLSELFINCLKEIKVAFREQSVNVKIEGVFPRCNADPTLFKQVISNLLHNAFEAVQASDVTERLVIIKGFEETDERGQKWAKIVIEDNGHGIKKEDLPFIFVPFFTTKQKGYGIGLALSHRIVTQHGGTLSADKSTLGGAALTIKIKAL